MSETVSRTLEKYCVRCFANERKQNTYKGVLFPVRKSQVMKLANTNEWFKKKDGCASFFLFWRDFSEI